MTPYIVGFIFARGGSKGVPRKNIRLLSGKPLIAYAIQAAQSSNLIERVIVSTDDKEILQISNQYGAETPFIRPLELAKDNSPELLAWKHAINMINIETDKKIDVFVSIPSTAPLRHVEDIDNCINLLLNSDADIVISVKKADRNPYFNMVTLDENGYAKIVMNSNHGSINRRQDAPIIYDVATVAYAARPEYILQANSIFEGKVKLIEIPPERALDIDTELDFRIAEYMIKDEQSYKSSVGDK
ncbi:acylneuraminate cytidylyltransferase family protein [Methanogenium marinum]|uniref:Acylneuraminate cytidylyltransferase family protein n=1 Tax=Methanogenium marinum TaxID=348610 RepID=A0A9Q4KRS7_9EURY|nr:acylneuraminate cytidylyltransferase family protein [Methanogenium marinum]MDE4907291.1 acylneuraminate cytidylyltransferase family protein [Methanogenium marinum]